MRPVKHVLRLVWAAIATLVAFILGMRSRREGTKVLIWGTAPLILNKYWSQAMKEAGWDSRTLMSSYSWVTKREDFDLYFEDLIPSYVTSRRWQNHLAPVVALSYIIRHAAVVHLSYQGGPLGQTPLWRLEAYLFKWAGIRSVVQPFGGDAYMYSQIMDPAVRNGFLMSYPAAARHEGEIAARVRYWTHHADIVVGGFILDGLGRWDVPVGSYLCIDTKQWPAKTQYSTHDGVSGPVKIMHAPNHRGVKGTEFVIDAVEQLKAEGLQIELVLLERVPNDRVRELMHEVDILADQLVLPGHGLNAIEGMASGLPVMSNLEDETYTRTFRRYSFLDECPIVSTSAETIKRNLKVLIRNPQLREELGRVGRQYAVKYHSYATAQYLYGSIYDKILHGKDVDLMNLYHPLKSDYNRRTPRVNHPLIDSQLPPEYFASPAPRKQKPALATSDG